MTVDSYIDHFFDIFEKFVEVIDTAIPDTEVEPRFIATEKLGESEWIGAMSDSTGKIRRCMISFKLITKDRTDKTAARKKFKPHYHATVDVFHEYKEGTDDSNTEKEFLKDILRLQYFFEQKKAFHPKARIRDYNFPTGVRPSTVQAMHFSRGEVEIELDLVDYD